MNISELLTSKKCPCGKVHSCDIKHVIIEKNALTKLSELCFRYNNIILIADTNTYAVCGEQTSAFLGDKLSDSLIFESEGYLVPNEESISKLESVVTDSTDLIVGIGSGVIQDLCKYVSFNKNLPYFIIATAPSMDGYASKGAAMITDNMKVTYNAHVPEAIIGDVDILKNAPIDMIKSGYGDILGKFSCLNDWKLSKIVNDEYFCDYVYDLTYSMLDAVKDIGSKLLKRDSEAIKLLMEALVGVGIAMAYSGNSRPASGSEHHLSHYFEITGLLNDEPYFMHGTDVAFSAVYTQRIREKLLGMNPDDFEFEFKRDIWEENIRKIYTKASDGVIALQDKLGWYENCDISVYKQKWDEITACLSEVPDSKKLIEYINSVELDISDFDKMYGKEKIDNALLYAKDLKDRYSVLWMYYYITNI